MRPLLHVRRHDEYFHNHPMLSTFALIASMWGIGFALVDMRQRKLLKRFVATPMRRSDFLLALMLLDPKRGSLLDRPLVFLGRQSSVC